MLTEKTLAQAKPGKTVYRVSDQIGNGLSLEVSPAGGKHWRFRYRFGGKAKMISLGAYPEVSLKEAREKAYDAKKNVGKGINPVAQGKKVAPGGLFRDAAKEWWELHGKGTMTDRYAVEVWGRIERDVLPFLGDVPLTEIDAPAVLEVLRRVESRGTLETVKKIRSHISRIMRYGIACGRIFHDPARDLSDALRTKKTTSMPSIKEPKEVGKLMVTIKGYTKISTRCALLLGAYTFVRPGELRRAQWTEFDFAEGVWRIPAEKMKMKTQHIVPLSRQSLEVLSELEVYSGGGRRPYLFPSIRTMNRPMSDNTVNAALRYLGYERKEMCGHGFRSMASTLLNERGYNRDWIERQLAHGERNAVRAAYNYAQYLPERRRMMQDWADYLDELESQSGAGRG
jgi:integrase